MERCKVCLKGKPVLSFHGQDPQHWPNDASILGEIATCYRNGFELEQKKNQDLTAQLARVRSILGIATREAAQEK